MRRSEGGSCGRELDTIPLPGGSGPRPRRHDDRLPGAWLARSLEKGKARSHPAVPVKRGLRPTSAAFGRLTRVRGGAPRGERAPLSALPRPTAQSDGNIVCVARTMDGCACRRSASPRSVGRPQEPAPTQRVGGESETALGRCCVARTILLIRPREAGEGDRRRRWRGRAAGRQVASEGASLAAEAPSTAPSGRSPSPASRGRKAEKMGAEASRERCCFFGVFSPPWSETERGGTPSPPRPRAPALSRREAG